MQRTPNQSAIYLLDVTDRAFNAADDLIIVLRRNLAIATGKTYKSTGQQTIDCVNAILHEVIRLRDKSGKLPF